MKKRLTLIAALCAVLALCLGLWRTCTRTPYRQSTPLTVLMFHHLVPDGALYNDWMLTESRFRAELQWLVDNGYQTVLPSQIARGDELPDKPVLLTFDDGYQSNYTLLYPILQEFQAKAAVALITQRVDSGHPDFLTWEMCREMQGSGLVEFGSHTHDLHSGEVDGILRLPGEGFFAYRERLSGDLQTSIDLIRRNTGGEVCLFAYPHGALEKWGEDILRRQFALTVTSIHGISDLSESLYQLRRINVTMEHGIAFRLEELAQQEIKQK